MKHETADLRDVRKRRASKGAKKMPTTKQPALDELLAQQKGLKAQIAAARAAERHLPVNAVKSLAARISKRIKSGDTLEQATDAVLAELRAALLTSER
jgi:hypothetical protein